MRNHSYANDFDLHENETACRTHFHMKGFALRLVLKQRHERIRKWAINIDPTQREFYSHDMEKTEKTHQNSKRYDK